MPKQNLPTGSFRDPAGAVLFLDGRVLRFLKKEAAAQFNAFLVTRVAGQLVSADCLISTRKLDAESAAGLLEDPRVRELCGPGEIGMVVEHDPIPFRSFPYEWTPSMLYAAGCLTLDLAAAAQREGFGLKDGTPYNVLYRGATPVFIDVASFERRDDGDATWLPYAQFVRTFILPLLASKHFGIPLSQVFMTNRDGLSPEDVYRLCGPLQKLRPPFLSMISLPVWFASERAAARLLVRSPSGNKEKSAFILQSLFDYLRRALERSAPSSLDRSQWSEYMDSKKPYSPEEFRVKEQCIRRLLMEHRPRTVLDIGCNTGYFAELAARMGATVIAIDSDAAVVSTLWRRAVREGLDILPLVVDLARPSPAIGWRNRECPAFLERARGAFQAVFMLATMHHLLVQERIPLAELIEIAAELTTDLAIMEFIAPGDPMFQRLSRGRDQLVDSVTRDNFEASCARHFTITDVQRIGELARWIYILRKTSSCAG